jgi:hypothetical protein
MKIRDRYTGSIAGTGLPRERDKTGSTPEISRSPAATDRVQFSGRSVEIQKARVLALQAPEVRQEMLDEIIGQIKEGNYHVTGTDVIPRMIREHLADAAE